MMPSTEEIGKESVSNGEMKVGHQDEKRTGAVGNGKRKTQGKRSYEEHGPGLRILGTSKRIKV